MKIQDIQNIGWMSVKVISGNLKDYATGGIALSVKPSVVIGITMSDGYVGSYDAENNKLVAYLSGSEASGSLESVTFTMVAII